MTIKEYGNEEMEIRLFELIKNLNYGQYCCLTSKYRADKKLNWDTKTIDIGSKVKISYYREKQNYEKQVPEVQEIIPNKYDIKSIRKRTFYTGKEEKEDEEIDEDDEEKYDIKVNSENDINYDNMLKSTQKSDLKFLDFDQFCDIENDTENNKNKKRKKKKKTNKHQKMKKYTKTILISSILMKKVKN